MKVNHISTFLFDLARYKISDGQGSEILLEVDYKNNKYSVNQTGQADNPKLHQEVANIAEDLLKRKHNVNFAKK